MISTTTLLLLINSGRQPQLKIDPFLTQIAEIRCRDTKEWSHKGFWDVTSKDILKKYKHAGENLAMNFPDATSTFEALEKSPTHHENNHAKRYTKVGIANCNNVLGNETVILFGGK